MFQLTAEEAKNLRFQIGTSKKQRGGRRYLPYAFAERLGCDVFKSLFWDIER